MSSIKKIRKKEFRRLVGLFSLKKIFKKEIKLKSRRGSPFVEEVGLILIALFFFVVLYSVFSEIIDSFVNIINNILKNLAF